MLVNLLIHRGADATVQGDDGRTSLHFLIQNLSDGIYDASLMGDNICNPGVV